MAWYDDILGSGSNIFGARAPDYLMGGTGLLNQSDQQKLTQRALTSGLLGTAITYLAQPKNQRYGSALPYIGKAFLSGPFYPLTACRIKEVADNGIKQCFKCTKITLYSRVSFTDSSKDIFNLI